MIDTKQFLSAIQQIAEEKGIPKEKIVETIEDAIAAAYKRDYGEKGWIVRSQLNADDGDIKVFQIKYVVSGVDEEGYLTGELPQKIEKEKEITPVNPGEEVKIKYSPEKHILLADAQAITGNLQVGDELVTPLETKTEFGRIAAQTAKQVIIQRLREVEREAIFNEFKGREGEVVSGLVQRREGPLVYIDLGRTNGLLLGTEQLPNDNYRLGQRLRFYIMRVEESQRGPAVLLSRTHPQLVAQLFALEVPEIDSGSVIIKTVAREAGSRSKVAVTSQEDGVDPIGSLVGQRGVRVQTVINELAGEKIDIIEWSDDPIRFITNALSPAKVSEVKILDADNHHALAEVNDDQFSLAIGKRGQNVRLAAKLTGWKIDVRSPQEEISSDKVEEEIVEELTAETGTEKPAETTVVE